MVAPVRSNIDQSLATSDRLRRHPASEVRGLVAEGGASGVL